MLSELRNLRSNLTACLSEVHDWCTKRRLKLNPDKTKLIWFSSKTNRKKLSSMDTTLTFGGDIIESCSSVWNLGVLLDEELTLQKHISYLSASCFFHLRRLRQLRHILSQNDMQRFVSALVIARLDYCNAVLAGLPSSTLRPLTRVMHAAVRLISNLKYYDSVHDAMKKLHWLPFPHRVTYKLCLIMYKAKHQLCPSYITDLLQPLTSLENRARLRSSSSSDYYVPRVRTEFGRRAFSVAGPVAWNKLPEQIRASANIAMFKSSLKTHLFNIAYQQ